MMAHIDMTMLKVWLVGEYTKQHICILMVVLALVVGVSRTSVGIKRQSSAHVLVRAFIIPH